MAITGLFDDAYFTGVVSTSDVPGRYSLALGGHTYLVDLTSDQTGLRGLYFRRESIPLLRSQADGSNIPDESSINPDDLWRRSQSSWHLGAGQTHLDRKDSDAARFRSSKGVNVWTKWQATLLPDTTKVRTSANNIRMVTAGGYTYLIDGQQLVYTANITATSPTFTVVTGTPVATAAAITTDGYTIYVAYPGGVYTTTRGAAAATAAGDTNAYTLLGYVKGRLMGAVGRVLYNLTNLAAPAAALYTHPNTDFTWVGFAEGPAQIYAAGYSGDKSLIYRTSVKADGTALDIPQVAGELPDGEIIRAIRGYLGYLIIGSDSGVRIAAPNANGDLTMGGLIPAPSVRCLSPSGRFVWFGWTNYDSTSTGLGRLDLQNFTFNDTPAYATDLMATAQGVVGSVVQASGTQVFAVDGVGIFNQSTSLVASGTIDSGLISYDLTDPKVALTLDVKTLPLVGSYSVALSADSGTFTSIGTNTTAGTTGPSQPFAAGQAVGETFEIRETLTRAADPTTGPTLLRHTLRSYPSPSRSFQWVLPLLVHEQIDPYGDSIDHLAVQTEIDYLFSLLVSRQLVTLQVGAQAYQVLVKEVEQLPYQLTADRLAYDSTVIVTCVEPGE